MSDNTRKKYGLSAFLPLAAFLIVYLGSGILFTALGYGSEPLIIEWIRSAPARLTKTRS